MAGKHDGLIGEVRAHLARLDLPEEVHSTILSLIRRYSNHAGAPGGADEIRIARGLYRSSLRRARELGPRMAMDSMWNMLLDLFIAHAEGRSISVSSLCIASGGPSTTALRQIGRLEEEGLVTRYDDERDGRRSWVKPTPKAIVMVREFITDWSVAILG